MIKKINNFLDRPITWKSSIKATGLIYLIFIPVTLIWYIHLGLIDNPIDLIKEKFKKKESGKEEEES